MITLCAEASVVPESSAPTTTETFSALTSLLAASTATWGDPWVSATTVTSFLPPNTPPWLFTWSTASFAASSIGGTKLATGPVTSKRRPILTSSSAALAGRLEASTTAAAPARKIFPNDLSTLFPPPGMFREFYRAVSYSFSARFRRRFRSLRLRRALRQQPLGEALQHDLQQEPDEEDPDIGG